MKKGVLDIGNCDPDHNAIVNMLHRWFSVDVLRAEQLEDALGHLKGRKVDLILVNRKLDIDYSDGIAIIRHLKEDPTLRDIPVMLVTNHADYQKEAVQLGAEYGFGKLELRSAETKAKLDRILADASVPSGG